MGEFHDSEAYLAIGQANQIQRAFHFDYRKEPLLFDKDKYRLPNGGYEFDVAVPDALQTTTRPRPLILLTSLPYGDKQHGDIQDYFFYGEFEADFDREVTVLSSYL